MTVPVALRHDETFVLNLGPQHPATHGVLHVRLTMDGEYINFNFITIIGVFNPCQAISGSFLSKAVLLYHHA